MQTAAKWNILQLTNSTDHSTSWKANSSSPSQETPYLLCKPKGSLQCSQGPATDPYLRQMHPIHTFPPYFRKVHSNIVIHICLGLSNGLFPWSFPIKILYAFLFSPIRATCHAHLILLDLVWREDNNERPVYRDLVGCGPGLSKGSILTFVLSDWGIPWRTSVLRSGFRTDIRTGAFQARSGYIDHSLAQSRVESVRICLLLLLLLLGLIISVFRDDLSTTSHGMSNATDKLERKFSCLSWWYYFIMCVERVRKTTSISVRISSLRANM